MFKHICHERDGDVLREVRPMVREVSHIIDVYARVTQVPNFLSKTNPAGVFLDRRCSFFEVDDVGLVAVIPLEGVPGCHVHVTFWDRILRGREEMCRTIATWIAELRQETLFTAIPNESRAVLAFAKRIGFEVVRDSDGITTLRFDRPT